MKQWIGIDLIITAVLIILKILKVDQFTDNFTDRKYKVLNLYFITQFQYCFFTIFMLLLS